MIKMSVIVPVYNCDQYIYRCINSILNQNCKDIELIAVDDGSTDNSLSILKSIAENDNRLKILCQENKGAGAARNLGLKNAIGEFVSFVDSDDCVSPDIYTKTLPLAKKYCVDCVQYDYKIYNEYYELIEVINQKQEYLKRNVNLILNKINSYVDLGNTLMTFDAAPWKRIYRRQFLIDNNIWFDEFKPCGEDVGFSFEVRMLGTIFYTSEILYNYTMRTDSISHNKKHMIPLKEILESLKSRIEKHHMASCLDNQYEAGVLHWCNVAYLNKDSNIKDGTFVQNLKKLVDINLIDEALLKEFEYMILTERVKQQILPQLRTQLIEEFKITPKKVLRTLFSVKNQYRNNKKYKVVSIFGLKLKFRIQKNKL